MEQQKNRIAIVSPSKNAYSETFIQSQKNGLKGTIFYYYDGHLPKFLENQGALQTKFGYRKNKIARKLGFTNFNAAEAAFMQSLKKNKIEVVLAQYGTTAHHIVKICRYLKIPMITHFHGYDASVNNIISSCNNYKEVFEYSSFVIAVSKLMKVRLIKLGCPSEKVIYNPCVAHPTFLEIEPKFKEPNFLALGRFVDKKAPYYTVLAFNKVLKKFPTAKLILGGDGPLFEMCNNLVSYLKIEDNVLFKGVIAQKEFKAYLTNSLAFVQHSITAQNGDQEGTPVAIMEASAAGLPVIATKHAGIQDVVVNGVTGFLVEEHDVETMADKMIELIENRELAIQMGNAGKFYMINNFTMKSHLKVLDELIVKSIAEP